MSLSDAERRLLEEMERNFYANTADGKADKRGINNAPLIPAHTNWKIAGLGLTIGIGCLIGGLFIGQIWLSVVGFLVMTVSVFYAMRDKQEKSEGGSFNKSQTSSSKPQKTSFGQKLEDRWQKYLSDNG